VDRIGPPEEIFRGNYIAELYGVEHGSYNAELGCVETEAVKGAPRVFVVGGGGSGIPAYRLLQRRGVPFAAGVLPENDADLPIAKALATEVVTDKAFEPVSAEAVDRALALAESCEKVVCAAEHFGSMTTENRRILDRAKEKGNLLTEAELHTL
jgi:iron complex transport system ATP-binding protein